MLNDRMPENIQNIQHRHKFHHKSNEKLKSGISDRKTNLGRGENPKKLL